MKLRKMFRIETLIFLMITAAVTGYRPVVLMHGILSDAGSMSVIAEQIKLVRNLKFERKS